MTANKKIFRFKSLVILLSFFLMMGGIIIPKLNTITYDNNNIAPTDFPVVVGSAYIHPRIDEYATINEHLETHQLLRENAEFDEYGIDFSLETLPDNLFELKAKAGILTTHYRYKIDDQNLKVIPISIKATGLITWIWAAVYMAGLMFLMLIGELMWRIWQKFREA